MRFNKTLRLFLLLFCALLPLAVIGNDSILIKKREQLKAHWTRYTVRKKIMNNGLTSLLNNSFFYKQLVFGYAAPFKGRFFLRMVRETRTMARVSRTMPKAQRMPDWQ